jgi:hypothetical protein
MWEPRRLTTLWASTARYRDSFTFLQLQKFLKGASGNTLIPRYTGWKLLNYTTRQSIHEELEWDRSIMFVFLDMRLSVGTLKTVRSMDYTHITVLTCHLSLFSV